MQLQLDFIQNLAKQYNLFMEDSTLLYKAVNELPPQVITDVYKEYGDAEARFQPVNILRAELARRLSEGSTISEKPLKR